jgi:hypothetical protein
MLNVIVLSFVMLNVVMLSVAMLNVAAPFVVTAKSISFLQINIFFVIFAIIPNCVQPFV